MERILWVCLGGAAGSGARYLVSLWMTARLGIRFPWATLCVNVTGSFLLGLILQLAVATDRISPNVQLALTVGVLGGFTTYSTFNAEVMANLERGSFWTAGVHVLLTVSACLAAGFLGQAAGRLLAGA